MQNLPMAVWARFHRALAAWEERQLHEVQFASRFFFLVRNMRRNQAAESEGDTSALSQRVMNMSLD